MSGAAVRLPSRRDPTVAAVVRQWRLLTSGRRASGQPGPGAPTLVACSGGADSCALVLALAAAAMGRVVVGHVVHDMRSERESLADRDAVRRLAELLGLRFVEARVSIRDATIDGERAVLSAGESRNAEAVARRLRYRALGALARGAGVKYIATAHHAGDQLETVLMALMRGAGLRGLRGVAEHRPMRVEGARLTIIRPMLGVSRAACEALCRECGWAWREDATNRDTARLRSYVRHEVVPLLRARAPSVEAHAHAASRMARDAERMAAGRARRILAANGAVRDPGTSMTVSVRALRRESPMVVGAVLRRMVREVTGGVGMDRVGRGHLDGIIEAVRRGPGRPRTWRLRPVTVTLTARTLVVSRSCKAGAPRGCKEPE